jgi:hypothetical protein
MAASRTSTKGSARARDISDGTSTRGSGRSRDRSNYALKLLPQPQVEVEFGLLNTKPEPMISSL